MGKRENGVRVLHLQVSLLVAVLLVGLGVGGAAMTELSVAFYNVFEGGTGRRDHLQSYLSRKGHDVVGMSELNGFDSNKLSTLGRTTGFKYSLFLRTRTGYHLGIVSRLPLRLLSSSIDAPFHHGYLAAVLELGDSRHVGLVVTHLSPHSSARRIEEVNTLLELVQQVENELGAVFLVGDLNQLSPEDADSHEHGAILNLLQADNGGLVGALRRKFLDSSRSAVDYAPMRALLEGQGGLVDAARVWGAAVGSRDEVGEMEIHVEGLAAASATSNRRNETEEEPRTTVPTKLAVDAMHAFAMRLDYILCSRWLAEGGNTGTFRTVVDELTRTGSDHYPVELHLEF